MVQAMQPSLAHPQQDLLSCEAELEQLPSGDHPVLSPRESRQRLLHPPPTSSIR
jgi:hypothetical protein